jgi:hypothetical protein
LRIQLGLGRAQSTPSISQFWWLCFLANLRLNFLNLRTHHHCLCWAAPYSALQR